MGADMDRLSPLGALFVDAEDQDPHVSMAIASIAVFEGPAPSHEEFLAAVAGRLPLVPRYRHKLRTIPFRLGRPVWVEDPHFDLGYHVRRTALPAPGGDEQLSELMGRVMSQRLDRDHPLWENWVAEGLAHGRWALISKVHHCVVDGVSGTDLYRVIFDLTPEPSPPARITARCTASRPRLAGRRGRGRYGADSAAGRGGAERRGRGPGPGRPPGHRHGAGGQEAGPGAAARHQVVAERAYRPPAAVHLGPGITRPGQGDQAGTGRHPERRGAGRDQQRLP